MQENHLVFDGERAIPLDPGMNQEVMDEHWCRYKFASRYVYGYILDSACGVGYGSGLLKNKAKNVVGVDISEPAIKYAMETYADANVHFLNSNILRLPFPDCYFDVVISFETIEHVKDGKAVMKEIARVINDNGILIVSVPSGGPTSNRFHQNFYQRALFEWFLLGFFKEIDLWFQRGDAITKKTKSPLFYGGFPGEYLVAICKLPRKNTSSMIVRIKLNTYSLVNSSFNNLVLLKRKMLTILSR